MVLLRHIMSFISFNSSRRSFISSICSWPTDEKLPPQPNDGNPNFPNFGMEIFPIWARDCLKKNLTFWCTVYLQFGGASWVTTKTAMKNPIPLVGILGRNKGLWRKGYEPPLSFKSRKFTPRLSGTQHFPFAKSTKKKHKKPPETPRQPQPPQHLREESTKQTQMQQTAPLSWNIQKKKL